MRAPVRRPLDERRRGASIARRVAAGLGPVFLTVAAIERLLVRWVWSILSSDSYRVWLLDVLA